MRTSIATVCLSGTLTDKLQAAANAGFDGNTRTITNVTSEMPITCGMT